MGWETRAGTGRYYTRSQRVGGRVQREYVGAGLLGELAARQDERERAARAAEVTRLQAERARWAAAEEPLTELCEITDLLVRLELRAAGYHQHHRGEWRKRREQGDQPD